MSAIKRWFEDHISEITDEELLEGGYEQEEIDFMSCLLYTSDAADE